MKERLGLFISSIAAVLLVLGTPTQSQAFEIGESYGGGIIFWMDSSGQNGLIAATSDQGYTWWGDRYYFLVGTTETAVGTGAANT